MAVYDEENVFAKILGQELPCNKIHETTFTLVFEDIRPLKKIHYLAIPKGPYTDFYDFQRNATEDEIFDFWEAIADATDILGISDTGFRLITNCGEDSQQAVPHFHVHIVGGEILDSKCV